MKNTLLLLALVGLMGSVSAKADSFDVKTSIAPLKKAPVRRLHQTTYLTGIAVTGSHIPLVVTQYGRNLHTNSSFIAYSAPQLDQTGQLNVGAELTQRDPAISSVRMR